MWDINEVTALEYRHDYVYRVTFDDGLEAEVDLARYLDGGPIFAPLKDVALFRQARIEGGTIAWPNGADIAPETLYEDVERANKSAQLSG